jgi:iron complex outermembrane receptor protein
MCLAQPCHITIQGYIFDHHENHALEFATIYIQEIKKGTVTSANGHFSVENICPGKYHIIVSHIGCESKSWYLDIQKDTTFNLYLEHHDQLLEEVVISGKDMQTKTGLAKSVISKDMMLENSGKNLSEMLSAIPGVSMLRSGPNLTKPIINGLFGNRITILNHGIPQEGQQWGNDHAPEVDPNTGDKLAVYKGANAIKYGLSSLGGLVVVEANELAFDPHFHGNVKLQAQSNGRAIGMHTSLLKSTKIGNTRWTAGYNQGGDRRAPAYYLTNTGNSDASISFLINNQPESRHKRQFFYSLYHAETGILRGSHVGNLSDLQSAFYREVPFFTQDIFSYQIQAPRQVVSHHLGKLSYKHMYSDHYHLVFEGGFQANIREEYDVRRGDRSKTPSLDLSLFSQYYNIQLNHQPQQPFRHHAVGIQYKNNVNVNNAGTGISPLIPNYQNHQAAIYFIQKNEWKTLPVEVGLRTEYRSYYIFRAANKGGNDQHQFINMAVNLGAKKEIKKSLRAALDISYTERPPEINELYSNGLHQGVSGIEEGNVDLQAEKSLNVVHEWNGQINAHHHINASVYFNRFWNFIYLQPTNELRLTIRGAFPVFRYVGADVAMAGWNIKSSYEINDQLQWVNALHYTYGQNLTINQGLIRVPPLNASSNLTYTLKKSKLYNELKIGVDIIYTAKQTRSNPSEDFLEPPDGYFLSNLFLRAKWKTKRQSDIDVIIKAENLMDVKYRNYLNRLRYFADEMGRNIYITCNLNF